MENCLVTKLKDSVNNPALVELGHFRVSGIAHSDYAAKLSFNYVNDGTDYSALRAKILDENYNVLSEVTPSSWYYGYYFEFVANSLPQNAAYLDIPEKYKINGINEEQDQWSPFSGVINFDDLKFCPINNINSYTSFFSDAVTLEELAASWNLTTLFYWDARVSGNIAAFGSLQNLGTLELSGQGVYGRLEELFEAWFAGYTADRNVRIFCSSTGVTFNGVARYDVGEQYFVTITSSGVAVGTTQGSSDLGTYNGSTWSYA